MREGRVKGGVRWRDGLLEELEGRDMIGDIVFNVFFIILGSLEEASLGVFAFIVLCWLSREWNTLLTSGVRFLVPSQQPTSEKRTSFPVTLITQSISFRYMWKQPPSAMSR